MMLKSNNSYPARKKYAYLHCFHLNLCGLYVWSVILSASIDNVYYIFMLCQALNLFIYFFNIQMIYRFRSCLSAQKKNVHIKPRDAKRTETSYLNIRQMRVLYKKQLQNQTQESSTKTTNAWRSKNKVEVSVSLCSFAKTWHDSPISTDTSFFISRCSNTQQTTLLFFTSLYYGNIRVCRRTYSIFLDGPIYRTVHREMPVIKTSHISCCPHARITT